MPVGYIDFTPGDLECICSAFKLGAGATKAETELRLESHLKQLIEQANKNAQATVTVSIRSGPLQA